MKRSIRSLMFAAVCCGSPLAFATEPSAAQDGDSSVVTVVLAPFDTMIPSVQHLARLGGGGMLAGTVKTALQQYTAGLDTSRPVGIYVNLDDSGNPSPVAALPLKDMEEFLGQLSIFGEPDDLGDGLYEMNFGNKVFFRNAGEWLYVGQAEDDVLNFKGTVTNSLKNFVSKYDILVDIHPQNIPDDLVEFLMSQMQQGIQQGAADLSPDEVEAAMANAEKAREQMLEAIDATESLKIGLAVNKSEAKTILDIGTKFLEGSKLADNIKKMKDAKAALGGVPEDGSMFMLQSLQLIAPEDVEQFKTTIDGAISAALKQIDDDQGAEKAKEFLTKLGELFIETANQGQLETALDIKTKPNLTIGGAFTVSDGQKVEKLAAEAASEIEKTGSSSKVSLKVNTGKHANANLHKLSISFPPNSDNKVRAIFGDRLTATLATTPKAVFVAVGKDCDTAIKSIVDRSAAKASSAGEAIKARFSMGQLLKFMQAIQTNPAIDAAVDIVSAGSDNILIDSKIGERDSVIRITIEDNVIKAASAAGQSAREGGF